MSVFSMSMQAGVLIVIIIIARALLLNRIPKTGFLILWGVAIVRMLIPFSIASKFSVYNIWSLIIDNNIASSATPQIYDPVDGFDSEMGSNIRECEKVTGIFGQEILFLKESLIIIWLCGMTLLLVVFALWIIKSYRELRYSIPIETNSFITAWKSDTNLRRPLLLLQSDRIVTPVAVGIIKPRIIIPEAICNNEQILKYILVHEYFHIRRFDMLWKLLAIVAVCVHWFNPLSWVMLILLNRDLEITCDEMVLHHFGEAERATYAHTLIDMVEWKKSFSPISSYFSKNSTEERIVAIMKYKKTTLWFVIATVIICGVLAVALLTNPMKEKNNEDLTFDNTERVHLHTGDAIDETDNKSEAVLRDNFSISNSMLSAGHYVVSEKTYSIENGQDFLGYSINWEPTGQFVQVGFISKEKKDMYLLDAVAGGSAAGTINTIDVPDGEYYVVVYAVADNSKSISVNATFEWKNFS